MAAPRSEGDRDIQYWRGTIDTRLKDIETSITKIGIDMERVKADIVDSNIKIAGYVKMFAVIVALFTLIAPFLIKLLFGLKP